jgi:hypothetical protein
MVLAPVIFFEPSWYLHWHAVLLLGGCWVDWVVNWVDVVERALGPCKYFHERARVTSTACIQLAQCLLFVWGILFISNHL